MTYAKHVRLAGLTYLGTIVSGLYAEVFVRGALFVRGDAAATAQAIFTSEPLFRVGLIADLAMLEFASSAPKWARSHANLNCTGHPSTPCFRESGL